MNSDDISRVMSILSSFAFGFASAYLLKSSFQPGKLFPAVEKLGKANRKIKLALVVRTDLKMGKGKVAAQCAHAAVSCYNKATTRAAEHLEQWESQERTKVVLATKEEQGLESLASEAHKAGLIAVVIHDAGHTQVLSGTATVVGIGPGPEELVDQVTRNLKPY